MVSYEGPLPNAGVHEARALNRARLNHSLRLACQLKPSSNLVITPLMNPKSEFDVVGKAQELSGKKQETVILLVDLRNFTKLSEDTLPYCVVYILNKYYASCGQVIEANGGVRSNLFETELLEFLSPKKIFKKNEQLNLIKFLNLNARPSDLNPEKYYEITEIFEKI